MKALLCLPNNMSNNFYKVGYNLDILDGDVDLFFLEKWLEKRLKSVWKYFLIPFPISLSYKELKQIINTKRNIKKDKKLSHFTILHHHHPTEVKKATKTLVCFATYVVKITE